MRDCRGCPGRCGVFSSWFLSFCSTRCFYLKGEYAYGICCEASRTSGDSVVEVADLAVSRCERGTYDTQTEYFESRAAGMKVLFDYSIFSLQHFGGVSRYIVELSRHLPQVGNVESEIFSIVHSNIHLKEYQSTFEKPVSRYIDLMDFRGKGRLFKAINNFSFNFYRKRVKPDIIHASYYKDAAKTSTPTCVTVHDMIHEIEWENHQGSDLIQQEKAWIDRKKIAIDNADLIFCVSESTKTELLKRFKLDEQKIHVTHLSCSAVFSDRNPVEPKPIGTRHFILYVGNRAWYKNFSRLLKAFQYARCRQDVDIVCFGGGPPTPAERNLIQSLGLSLKVRFESGSDQTLARLYRQALCFVFPSRYEGFGIPLLESMASGCPVLCSNIDVFREICGETVTYFDPNSTEDLRDSLDAVATRSAADRESLVRAAAEVAHSFSWKKTAEKTFQAYISVV